MEGGSLATDHLRVDLLAARVPSGRRVGGLTLFVLAVLLLLGALFLALHLLPLVGVGPFQRGGRGRLLRLGELLLLLFGLVCQLFLKSFIASQAFNHHRIDVDVA